MSLRDHANEYANSGSEHDDLRDQIAADLRDVIDYEIIAEWICCDPVRPDHDLCTWGDTVRKAMQGLLSDHDGQEFGRSKVMNAVMAVVQPALDATDTEIKRFRRRCELQAQRIADLQGYELGIKSLTTGDGSINMSLHMAHDWMRAYVAAFTEILDKQGGPNYCEMSFKLAGTLDAYTVTVRRPNGKTPGEVASEQRQRAEHAEAERDQLRYERRLLGFARMTLDLVASGDETRWPQARREAEEIAQRIVDEIGHPVTDEPALGPSLRAELKQAEAERDKLRALVRALTDPDDCSYDHHGGCQTHGYLSLEPGECCPHAEAKEILAALNQPEETPPNA